jgi:hypothetical protein
VLPGYTLLAECVRERKCNRNIRRRCSICSDATQGGIEQNGQDSESSVFPFLGYQEQYTVILRPMRLFVAVTDKDWFALDASKPNVEEVNFWRPSPDATFKALHRELLLFKLHYPTISSLAAASSLKRFCHKPGIASRKRRSGLADPAAHCVATQSKSPVDALYPAPAIVSARPPTVRDIPARVPGVNRLSASTLIAELGLQMQQFGELIREDHSFVEWRGGAVV